jgi:hypothetical protein
MVQKGHVAGAIEIFKTLQGDDPCGLSMLIAVALAKSGHDAEALHWLTLEKEYQGMGYTQVATAQLKAGRVAAALATFARVTERPNRSLAEFLYNLVCAGAIQEFKSLLVQCVDGRSLCGAAALLARLYPEADSRIEALLHNYSPA